MARERQRVGAGSGPPVGNAYPRIPALLLLWKDLWKDQGAA